jgi:hypothetical protein
MQIPGAALSILWACPAPAVELVPDSDRAFTPADVDFTRLTAAVD